MKIINDLLEKNFNYTHCVEVSSVSELKMTIESLVYEFFDNYTKSEIYEFFDRLRVYSLCEENDKEIYDLNIKKYASEIIIECEA